MKLNSSGEFWNRIILSVFWKSRSTTFL